MASLGGGAFDRGRRHFIRDDPREAAAALIRLRALLPKTFGVFTLVQPIEPGEMVRVSIPVGELVSRAFKGVAAANQRRQEAAARRRVQAAVKQFQENQPADDQRRK